MSKLEKKDITFTDEQWGYDEVKQRLKFFLDEGNFLNILIITEDTYVHQGIEVPAFCVECAAEGVQAVLFPFSNDNPTVEGGVMENCYWSFFIIDKGKEVIARSGVNEDCEKFIKDFIKIITSGNLDNEDV